jgi:8-oxo-dGTP diphosphatase
MSQIKRFNLRVYALLLNPLGQILVTKEKLGDKEFHKFPGGGLELGEGPMDGIRRELREELDLENIELNHFFTTDEFVKSAFRDEDQIISIYYIAIVEHWDQLSNVDLEAAGAEILERKWLDLNDLFNHIQFPMDLKASKLLIESLLRE